jgi:hypothetical protein
MNVQIIQPFSWLYCMDYLRCGREAAAYQEWPHKNSLQVNTKGVHRRSRYCKAPIVYHGGSHGDNRAKKDESS